MARTRTYEPASQPSYLRSHAGYVENAGFKLFSFKCVDNPPGMFKDLEITKCWTSNPSFSGGNPGGTTYVNFCPLAFRVPANNNPYVAIPGSPTNGAAATDLLSKTNPNRPIVDLPLFAYELRELPKLFRIEGRNILQNMASLNLNYHFGWRPLISDLLKLLDFSDAVASRTKELNALYESGLRRKRELFRGSYQSSVGNITSNSSISTIHHSGLNVSQERVWGYVEWYPTSMPPETQAAVRRLARNAVLGLSVSPSLVWEAIPFSWLVDWCSNVGTFLNAHRNAIPVTHRNLIIMRHRKAETKWTCYDGVAGATVPDVTRKKEIKSRAKASPALTAHLPFLSFRQLSILGSIGLLSGRRRGYGM